SATAKGKQPARAITPTEPTDVQRTEAEQLKIILKRSRQEAHISQQRSFEEEGSFDPIPRTPEGSEKESNDEEDQELRLSDEARIQEEEADELYQSVNATLEAKVLTQSSYSSRTSYAIVADLSEIELKKILIEKMEGIKSIQRSDEQRNLYKALVEAYDTDKAILDTY
nr:hypothetical protein [Tanacetum cinerariifolium]